MSDPYRQRRVYRVNSLDEALQAVPLLPENLRVTDAEVREPPGRWALRYGMSRLVHADGRKKTTPKSIGPGLYRRLGEHTGRLYFVDVGRRLTNGLEQTAWVIPPIFRIPATMRTMAA